MGVLHRQSEGELLELEGTSEIMQSSPLIFQGNTAVRPGTSPSHTASWDLEEVASIRTGVFRNVRCL